MKPIKNQTTEDHAVAIATAIKNDDRAAYDLAMKAASETMDRMMRWELLAFRERVHFLANYGLESTI